VVSTSCGDWGEAQSLSEFQTVRCLLLLVCFLFCLLCLIVLVLFFVCFFGLFFFGLFFCLVVFLFVFCFLTICWFPVSKMKHFAS